MKSPLIRRVIAAVSTIAVMGGFIVAPAMAQTQQGGNGFRISPVRQEFVIDKGQSDTLNMTVENPADVAVSARAIVNDFVASDKEDGEPRLILDDTTDPPKNSFKTLVQPIADLQLAPKEKKDIAVTISVPDNANSGGYYGAVRFAPVDQDTSGGNVGLTASVGTIVLVTVPGDLTEQLDLIELTASQGGQATSFITNGEVVVLTRLKNEGDIHLKPFGKITVKNMFGSLVHESEFNAGDSEAERANVLPGSTRKFENNAGQFKIPGRYTINANIGVSQGSGDVIIASSTFWYMPIWAIAALVAIIAAIIGGIYYLYRKISGGKAKHGVKK